MIGWKNASNNAKVASVRIRCLEPVQILQGRGVPVELFRNGHTAQYKVVVFNKIYDQFHLDLARRLKGQGTKVVLDLCDNHFYNPKNDPKVAERGNRLREMLALADVVTVPGTQLQSVLPVPSQVIRDGVRPLSKMETWQRGLVKRFRRHERNLVWFGNWGGTWGGERRAGGMSEMLPHRDRLVELAKKHDLGLTIISNNRKVFDETFGNWDMPVYYEKWGSDARLRRNLARFDGCLLPVSQDPFTLCKSNNRLALALYLGLPVIADEIPAYSEFAPYCILNDWENGLESLVSGQNLSDVRAGKEFVESHYMTIHAANDWQQLFDRLS
ncbi:hypothetical protein EON80_22210 [bacterium]|nr:MAG: hypothetical protein EON80_22210 [bacterium]